MSRIDGTSARRQLHESKLSKSNQRLWLCCSVSWSQILSVAETLRSRPKALKFNHLQSIKRKGTALNYSHNSFALHALWILDVTNAAPVSSRLYSSVTPARGGQLWSEFFCDASVMNENNNALLRKIPLTAHAHWSLTAVSRQSVVSKPPTV